MENNPIQEELKHISPELASLFLDKKPTPAPDPGYFEELPDTLLDKVKEAPVISMRKKFPSVPYLIGGGVAAALMGIMFMIGQPTGPKTQNANLNFHEELSKISEKDLESFLVYPDEQIAINTEFENRLEQIDSNEIISFIQYN